MTVPSMEELRKAFRGALAIDTADHAIDAALVAVLDRLKPVVAEAYDDALFEHTDLDAPARSARSRRYATLIIDKIKGA